MNPETLAIARENLISLGIRNPTPEEVALEAKRLYEANKVHPRVVKLLILLLAVSLPTHEQMQDLGKSLDRILDTRIL